MKQNSSLVRGFPRKQNYLRLIVLMLGFYVCSMGSTAAQNLALGKTVTSSINYDATLYPNSNLVDGNFNTFAATNNLTALPNSEWFMIDLGADYFIDSVVIGCRNGSNRIRRFMLVTWPSTVGSGLGGNPNAYLSNALYNRLIYTDANNVTNSGNAFGQNAANPIVPGTPGQNLGPVFPGNRLNLHIGIHKARYVLILNLQDEILDPTELQVYAAPPPVRAFVNGGFEQGYTGASFSQVREGLVDGWSTTEGVSAYFLDQTVPNNGSYIELWRSGYSSVPSYAGNYFAELNAFTNGMLEQQPICVRDGESFSFSFAHRGRSGIDTMRLNIDNVDVAQFADQNTQAGTHTFTVLTPATTTVAKDPTTATGWTRYSGTWTNTTGASKIVSFGYRAVGSAGGAISGGNFLDEVIMTSMITLINLEFPTGSGSETTPTANLPRLILNGTLAAAGTIQLDITGGTATRGTDYNTTPASGLITVSVPAGTYDGTTATAISLAPYLRISTDQVSPEANETINISLVNPSTGLAIADAASCALAISSTVYTITNVVPPNVANDSLSGQTAGSPATIPNILGNDSSPNGGLSADSISLVLPSGATNPVTDAQGDITGFTVPGEGTWSLNSSTGALTFTPQAGFAGDPTPITYTVTDATGQPSAPATVAIDYNTPLPARLLSFTGHLGRDCTVMLEWSTAKEENLAHYAVQGSKDGIVFETLNTLSPKGSYSKYEYRGKQPNESINFYRLQIVDRDETVDYSPVLALKGNCDYPLKIYPNPILDRVTIEGLLATETELKIYNTAGKLMLRKMLKGSVASLDISDLPEGLYHFVIHSAMQSQSLRVIKK